jgi:phospholipid-translocating ATPase
VQVDLFQEYEQDLPSRKRFEEAASSELQQGWNRGNKRTSAELRRENEVQELLDRPRVMEEGWSGAAAGAAAGGRRRPDDAPASGPSSPTLTGSHGANGTHGSSSGGERRSADIQEMLIRRFGSIKRA